jgi:hypothetical protein
VRGWSKLTRLAEAGGVSKNFYWHNYLFCYYIIGFMF